MKFYLVSMGCCLALACSDTGTARGPGDGGGSGASAGGGSGSSGVGGGGAATGGHAGANGGNAGRASGGTAGAATGGHAGSAAGGNAGAKGSGGSLNGNGGMGPGDAGGADAAADPCASCAIGSLCVEHQTEGGALILADAGRCPNGRIPSGGPRSICQLPPSYECQKLPAACTPAPGSPAIAHCTCARSLCASANLCEDLSPTLMKCTLQAP